MFDVLKKIMLNVTNGELNTEEACENVEEKITVGRNPKEADSSDERNTQEPNQNEEEKILFFPKALEVEEQKLLAEKSELMHIEEMLKKRIREGTVSKRHKIESLKHELPELKQRCELLAKALDIPVQK